MMWRTGEGDRFFKDIKYGNYDSSDDSDEDDDYDE
jgi:hypothetical protein